MSDFQNNIKEGSILIPRISIVEKAPQNKNGEKRGSARKNRKVWKIIATAGAVIILIFCVFGLQVYAAYKTGLDVKISINKLETSVKEGDLNKVKTELKNTKITLGKFKRSYQNLFIAGLLPYFGSFYRDGGHVLVASDLAIESGNILIEALEPYADMFGFKGGSNEAQSGEQSAQERIDFIVKTLPSLTPKADELSKKMNLIKKEVDQIDVAKYPEKIKGKEVRSNLQSMIDITDQAADFLDRGRPLLQVLPYLLGVSGERRYLILFQNDKELRPTGGFMTAYSIAKVANGRFEPVLSSDIYNLDSTYKPKVKAPAEIVKYLKGPYLISGNLRLRDMNWSPDFAESMKLFTKEAESAGIKNIDGVISVDTQVLVKLLNVIGPIGVPGFGNFSDEITKECNCPQVIFELESFADVEGPVVWSQDEPGKIIFAPPNYDNRKKIIGPLMNSILANTLAQPKSKFPKLFQVVTESLTEKHILFFVFDKDAQEALRKFGAAGSVDQYSGDYLYINDANLGGRKSNLYVTQDVNQTLELAKDGSITKTVVITYKNPEKQDGWLNSILPNWLRVYVPKGSQLLSFDGVESKKDAYEEYDKTVFSGFLQIRPQGVAKVTLKYRIPMKNSANYKILIQKQPGKDSVRYTFNIGKREEEYLLKTDKEISLRLK